MSSTPRKIPQRRLRILLRFGVILSLVLVIIIGILIYFVAPHFIVEPPRRDRGVPPPRGIEAVQISVSSDLILSAWQARPSSTPPRAIVIILHGIADSKASQVGTLQNLRNLGFLAIAPDLRAHGNSPGLASYGYHEKEDLSKMRESLQRQFPATPIGIWGTSYGGAVALQAVGSDPKFSFAIIESTFADLPDMARQQVKNHTTLPITWLAPIAMSRAGDLSKFDPVEVSPENSMAAASIPILHFHAEDDEVIPFSHGIRIKSQNTSKDYRFISFPTGGHYQLQHTNQESYQREVTNFLNKVAPQR